MLAELILVLGARALNTGLGGKLARADAGAGASINNTEALGRLLYTKYVYFFQGAGLILLVAMIGAIVLTLRHKEGVRRQSIAAQVARNPETAMRGRQGAGGSARTVPGVDSARRSRRGRSTIQGDVADAACKAAAQRTDAGNDRVSPRSDRRRLRRRRAACLRARAAQRSWRHERHWRRAGTSGVVRSASRATVIAA